MAVACKGLKWFSHGSLRFSSPFPSPHPTPTASLGLCRRQGLNLEGVALSSRYSSGNTIGLRGLRRRWRIINISGAQPHQESDPAPQPAVPSQDNRSVPKVHNVGFCARIWVTGDGLAWREILTQPYVPMIKLC